ncbi:unnamed protein product, partial [Pelagomonas calceolata]
GPGAGRASESKSHKDYLLNVADIANSRRFCSSCLLRSAGLKANDDTILGGVEGGGVGGGGGHSASCKYKRSFFRGFLDFKIASFNSSGSKGAPVFGLISSYFGSTFRMRYRYLSILSVSLGNFQGHSPMSTMSFGSGILTFLGVRRSMTFFLREAVSALARIRSSSVPPLKTRFVAISASISSLIACGISARASTDHFMPVATALLLSSRALDFADASAMVVSQCVSVVSRRRRRGLPPVLACLGVRGARRRRQCRVKWWDPPGLPRDPRRLPARATSAAATGALLRLRGRRPGPVYGPWVAPRITAS